MILTADIGNTRIKYALWSDDHVIVETGIPVDHDELFERVSAADAFAWCSTIGPLPEKFQHLNIRSFEMTPGSNLPFINKYKTPFSLGRDRMAAVAGALSLYPGRNILIVDAGTCITTDFLTSNAEYLGGSISPGLEMRYKALNTFTEKLPLIKHRTDIPLIGRNTEESILTGVWNGILGEVNFRVSEIQKAYSDVVIIITGGDGPGLADQLKFDIFAEPFLIHRGLLSCFLFNENS